MQYGNTKNLFNRFFDVLDAGITEFEHFSGVGADHVIVLFFGIRFFKLRLVFTELVFFNQITGKQEFDGVVQGGATHTVLLVFHFYIERFNVKMPIVFVDFIEYGKSLRSFPVTMLLKVAQEYLSYCFFGVSAGHKG